jgi:hypothetical protein
MRVYRIFRLLRGDRRVMRRETLRKGRGGVRRRGHQSTSSKDETRLRAAGAMGGRRDEKRYERGGAAFATRASVNIIQRTKHGYAPQARPPERSGASGPRERRRWGVRRDEKRYEKGGTAFATRASVNIIQRTKRGYAPQARPVKRSGASGPRERRRWGVRRDEKRDEKGGRRSPPGHQSTSFKGRNDGYAPQARPPERSGASGPRERRRRGVRRGEAPRSREDARSITDDRCSASAACRDDDQQHEYEDGDCSDGDPDGARIPCAAAAVNVDVHLRRLRRLG